MGKIFCIMGKSSSGKDSIYRQIMEENELSLKPIIPYTTRPVRMGEKDGREYHFCSEETVGELEAGNCGLTIRFTVSGNILPWMTGRLI